MFVFNLVKYGQFQNKVFVFQPIAIESNEESCTSKKPLSAQNLLVMLIERRKESGN